MTTEAISVSELSGADYDRTLLYASSILLEPFCKTYELVRYRLLGPLDSEKFNNYPIVQEIAFRALIATGTSIALCLLILYPISFTAIVLGVAIEGKILRAIGFALQGKGYTHVQTKAPKIPVGPKTTIAMQNFCGMAGGMHYDRGGVTDWRSRVDDFVETILEKKPHVIILQEIYDTALAETLVEKLGHVYPHFFMHLGANLMGSVGGMMVITDHPVDSFTNISFKNNDWTLNRTFAVLEIENIRIIGTHLIHGKDADEIRKTQVDQIIHFIADQKAEKLTLIGADFNVERDKEGLNILTPYLEHGYKGMQPTCTNKMSEQWTKIEEPDELIDNISQVKAVRLADGRKLPVVKRFRIDKLEIIPAFDGTYNTKTALSDHHGMIATISTKNKRFSSDHIHASAKRVAGQLTQAKRARWKKWRALPTSDDTYHTKTARA